MWINPGWSDTPRSTRTFCSSNIPTWRRITTISNKCRTSRKQSR
uniref:Uncharacterized protein n=1 Tax=Meloidogyne enterolobii TaxID=390850 RepID=A0A6V7X7E5_MELEN|nr:unnamed protein product [Meloidogyne enterolobii]